MSTSVAIVNSGTVALDSAIRRAMTCWVRESSWTLTSPFAVPVSAMLAGGGGRRRGRGGLRLGRRRLGGSGRGLSGRRAACGRRGRLRGGAGGCRLDVGLDDPPARPGALQAGEVDALLARDAPRDRRGLRAAAVDAVPARPSEPAAACAGSGSGAAAGGSAVAAGAAAGGASLGPPLPDASACCVASAGAPSPRRRLAAGADARDDLADGQRVALLGDDRQRAGACRPRRSSWPCRSRSPRARRRGRPRRLRP